MYTWKVKQSIDDKYPADVTVSIKENPVENLQGPPSVTGLQGDNYTFTPSVVCYLAVKLNPSAAS